MVADTCVCAFLKCPEVRGSIAAQHDHLAIDDEVPWTQPCSLVCNRAVSFGPVMAFATINRDRAVPQMELHAKAVELDFMSPFIAGRWTANIGGQARCNVVRIRRDRTNGAVWGPLESML